MTDFIVNPRRAHRAPSRCRVRARTPGKPGSDWDAETEDVGPHGCQLVAPAPLTRGVALQLSIAAPGVKEPLQAAGRVAWVSPHAPWRLGVAFEEAARPAATRWFELLVAARPGLGNFRRVPERLPVDAMVFLCPPPRFADFAADEVTVIQHVASGISIATLRRRLQHEWPVSQRALFALLSRGVVTVARGAATQPEAWRAVMADLGAEFVVEPLSPRKAPLDPDVPAPQQRSPAPTPTPAAITIEPIELEVEPVAVAPDAPPPPPVAGSEVEGGEDEISIEVVRWGTPAAPEPSGTPEPAPLPSLPALVQRPPPGPPGTATAGTGWRGTGRARSADAQTALDLALRELEAGRSKAAMALLRRALQLAPGDPEVAEALGRAMKG